MIGVERERWLGKRRILCALLFGEAGVESGHAVLDGDPGVRTPVLGESISRGCSIHRAAGAYPRTRERVF